MNGEAPFLTESQTEDTAISQIEDNATGRNTRQQRRESNEQDYHAVVSQKRRRVNNWHGSFEAPFEGEDAKASSACWSVEEHRAFADAIYNIGLKHSSPTVIRENMSPTTPEAVTLERIKSHLQKYRAKRIEAEKEFLGSYDAWMSDALRFVHGKQNDEQDNTFKSVDLPADMTNIFKLSSGAIAAHIGFSVMMEPETQSCPVDKGLIPLESFHNTEALPFQSYLDDHKKEIQFPRLSVEEKQSSLGLSMCLVMGLFITLRDELLEARKRSGDMKGQYRDKGANNTIVLSNQPRKEPQEAMNQSDQAAIAKDAQPRAPVGLASSSESWSQPPPHRPMKTSLVDYAANEQQLSIQRLPLNSSALMQMPILDSSVDLDVYQAFRVPIDYYATSSSGNRAIENGNIQSRQEMWGIEDSQLRETYIESRNNLKRDDAHDDERLQE